MNIFNCPENFHLGFSSLLLFFISEKMDVLDLLESNFEMIVFQQMKRGIALSHG